MVTVGDEEAEEGLLSCLAKGADRAVRVWDDALADAEPLAVARVLAAAVEREAPDLVLCGVQSSDAVNGATGVALAGYLDLPHVAVVKQLDWDAASGTATVERELEGGLVEVLRIRSPALLTIQTGINEPRYATLRAIKQAREKPLEVVGLDELGLDEAAVQAAAGSRTVALAAARARRGRRDAQRLGRRRRGSDRRDRPGADGRMSGILVVAETRRGELREVSLELIERGPRGEAARRRPP